MTANRIAYTVGVKLRAIEYAEIFGNAETGRTLGISESCIRRWRQHKDLLKTIAPGKRTRRGGKAKNPVLEHKLKTWVLGQLEMIQPVTMIALRFKATALAKQLSTANFSASREWAKGFLRRNGFLSRELGKGVETVEIRVADASGNGVSMLDVFADEEPQVFNYRPNVAAEPEPEPEPQPEPQPTPADSTESRFESEDLAEKFMILKQRSMGFVPKNGKRAQHLHSKFKALEQNILGSTAPEVEESGAFTACDLCDKPFECTVEDGPKSIRDLVCRDCMEALRNLRVQEQPHQMLESRLLALEATVAALKDSAVVQQTTTVKKATSSTELDRDALLRENAELRRRLEQYEKAEREEAQANAKDLRVTLVKLNSPTLTQTNVPRLKPMPASKQVQRRAGKGKKKSTVKSPKTKITAANKQASPPAKLSGEFMCFVCESPFKTKTQMQLHIESEHGTKTCYPCPACSKSFLSLSTLQRHCHTHPGFSECFSEDTAVDLVAESEPVASTSGQRSNIKISAKQCHGCRKRFSSVRSMIRHTKTCKLVQDALYAKHPTSLLQMECEEDIDDPQGDGDGTEFVDLDELSEQDTGVIDQELPDCDAMSLMSHFNGFVDPSEQEDAQSEQVEIKIEATESDSLYAD